MAVKDCDELSNIISLGIISGDEELAEEIARLSAIKKDALMRSGNAGKSGADDVTGRSAHELELRANSADIEMRAIVQAKILEDEVRVGDAYRELAYQITESGGTMAGGVEFLEKLSKASPADYELIAKQWGGQYAKNPAKALKEMKDAMAETISANYSIRQYSDFKSKGLADLKKQLKNGDITKKDFEKKVKQLHSDAMEQIAKGENPKGFAKLDSEWAAIKKVFGEDPAGAGKAWSQFIMARELLSDGGIDDGILKAFETMGAENLTGDLTLDQIAKYGKRDLDKLLARAYTNTEQLYRDGTLRQAYREKLIELTSGMRVTQENIKKANSIMKTIQFTEQGATLSDFVMADNAARSARKRGYGVEDGTAFLNALTAFAKKMDEDVKLLDNPIVINKIEMKPLDVIQIIYDITGDVNILKLLKVGAFDDGTVLSVATTKLLGDTKGAAEKILRLFAKAGESPEVVDVRDISLKAITGIEVKEGSKIGFFDFRKSLYSKDELNRARADFMDKLAERNRMRVSSDGMEMFDADEIDADALAERLVEKLKGGYLIVNDSRYKDNDILSKALNIANEGLKEDDKITVLFPRGGMSANFSIENGLLYYKTIDDDMFRDVSGTISIQSLGEARPTKEIFNTAYEAKNGVNPETGKPVDAQKAMMKYNKELNNVAVKYFGEMLGVSSAKVDKQYVNRVEKLLSEKLGIDLKSFDQIQDKAKLWQRIDKQFSLERITAGKYDKEIVDINAIKNEISNLTNEELEERIKEELGDTLIRSDIQGNPNIEHIRETYLDYKTAGSAVDSLMAKGKIISLANGGTAQTMSMDDIKNMFQNKTFEKVYKEIFFPNQDLSKEDMKIMIGKINNNIFDTLSISFAENLVSAGYELPLINIKSLVYDYLYNRLDLNNKFVEAFLYKNNIPFSQDGLKTIVDTLMPAEFRFDYENSLFKGRLNKLELPSQASVIREVDNRFLQDSYSAIASIQMAKAGDMPINYEEKVLTDILDKYVSEVYKGVKDKSLTFQKAEQLKQEAGYALDMFEQDFLLPRYNKFVSKQEMNGIMGMKYSLPIGVSGQNPDKVNEELIAIRNKLLQKYKTTLKNAANNNDINMAIVKGTGDKKLEREIALRRDKLAESGGVIREVNGQYLVYDVKQSLEEALNNLPDTIGGLEGLRILGRAGIDRLSNKQAYAILRYIEAAKGLSTKLNYPTELMYKQNPMLLKYNFFETYKAEDGLPRVLHGNILNGDKMLSTLDNTTELDKTAKKNIFAGVISKFREQGYITTEDLNKIVHSGVAEAEAIYKQIKLGPKEIKQAMEKMETLYRKVFLPYTYLRDIPKGGQLLDGTPVRNMKKKVEDTIKLQYRQAMDDLKAIGIDNAEDLQTSIYISLDNGERVSIKEAGDMNIDSWKKSIFNDESIFVAGADEIKSFAVDPTGDKKALDKVVAQQKEYRNSIINSYDSTLQSMLSQTQIISEAEADLSTAFMNDVRTVMRKYSLTNMMVDAMDALSGLNEEAARGMKDYLIGWKGRISFGKWKPGQILERNKLVQDAYRNYYVMDISKLNSITPTSQAEDLALRLAKYFKNLERLLGSADGLTGCTTNKEINKAFFHLGEVVMNVNSVKGIFGLMSAVEQNQILKFFKFANISNNDAASIFVRRGKGNFQESLGGYRDYVEEISGISRDEFNEIFGADFSEEDFKRILQGLTGFTLTGAWGRTGTKILNVLNGSNMIFRMMMSYPGQLLTIPQQGTAYFLKQIGFERELGVESLSEVDAIRTHYGVLDGAYNEIVLRGKSTVSPDDLRLDSYYNRYGIPDVDGVYKTSPIESSDDYINMYAKIDKEAASSISSTNKWFRQLDPYKDNANNIIDGLFARNFKNISFLKAIKNNDFMQFGSAKEFMSFMDDATISADIKTRLMDRVSAYSGRNFRNILGLGFGGIDRAVSGSGFGNIMYGLMQLFNFRGSWGQNIFKQTGSNIFTALKMLGTANGIWSREGREAIAQYIATRPEFTNFVGALFNDLKWTWKLQRFQDNGRWPEDEDMYGMLDFIDYMTETLNMTSQWYQGLQSFGPFRPFDEARQSIMASAMNPTIYKDTFGVGAFFNALGKNFGRQWKPYNWIAKLAGAWTTDGPDGAWAYIENEWWKLSFGSLRYMVNEDMNSYGYTYEMTGQTGGIPSIIMGESKLGSDKNFSYEIDNTETWETIKQMFDSGLPWDTRWTYAGNLAKTFINGSQLAALPKNVMKAINRNASSYFTANDLADTMQNTRAGLEFYKKGIVTPQTPEEAEIFFNTMLENAKYRPGSSNFTKSLIQYEDYGHMNGKESGNEADTEMELWLDHMKHITNEHGEIQMNGSEKVVDPSWNKLIEDVKAHGYNETYTTNLIYNYAKNWLNNHSSDPNYQLYVKMLGQGQAYNLISTRESQLIEALNAGAKGKDNKWTKTEFENVGLDKALLLKMGQQPLEGENISFFDKLQVLDEDDATVAALQIIQSQAKEGDRKILDRFFNVKENDDGSKSVSLKYNYEQTLRQIGAVSKAIEDGDVNLAVAEASILTNMYKNSDPTGAITATLIDSIYNRIYDTDSFSPEQKQAAMIALFHKNKEFIQKNPEQLRALLGDDYDVYADYMNSMLYQWDGMAISNLESMQTSGKGSSGSGKAASSFSSALKNLASKLGGSGRSNGGAGGTTSYKQWVPVTIKGASLVKDLGLKGYTPEVSKISISKYKPHLDLSLAKDINRNVKATKTQQVSTKKQLSDIEKKTSKALEAES